MVVPILILLIFVALIVNTGVSPFRWLRTLWPGVSPVLCGLVFGLAVAGILILFVLSRVPNVRVPRFLLQWSHYGLGIFVYALLFVNVTAFLLFVGRGLHLFQTSGKYVSLAALLFCTAAIIGFSAYGIIHAGSLKTVSYHITLDSGRKTAEPIRISLISDIHLGYIVEEKRLQEVADAVNDADPDLVCIAGDLFDGDFTALSDSEALKEIFRSIKAPVYACLGNHDAGESYQEMLSFLEDAGIHVLMDEPAVVEDRLLLVGRRDSSPIGMHEGSRNPVEIPEDNMLPVIVLDHQPGNISQYRNNVDLILCGHTHRGQLFPANLVTGAMFAVDYGYYRADADAPQVVVTSGAGTWGPVLRVGSDCEVAEIIIE